MNDLVNKYHLTQNTFQINSQKITLYQTENLDSLIDSMTEEEYAHDERFPFFLNIWDSGIQMANFILSHTEIFHKKKVLELGSGTGIAGIAAGLCQAQVIFSDYEEEALQLSEINAQMNKISHYSTLPADWRNFPTIDEPIDIVIGADLLYENRQVDALLATLVSLIHQPVICFLSDPSRDYLPHFINKLEKHQLSVILFQEIPNLITPLRNIKIYKISKST
ncbi:MAG: protein N-lysine methyltransferase family protein [Spirochaetes bacterium]|nr:protein N-lysine methyltransferase family protein [Spirochaetota bacterium]